MRVALPMRSSCAPSRITRRGDIVSTFGNRYAKFAGAAKGLPADLAQNHDHYLTMKKIPVKKAAKPVRVTKPAAPSVIIRSSILDLLEVSLTKTTEASGMFGERLAALQVDPHILQDDLAAVAAFDRLGKVADAPPKAFKDWAKALREQREHEARAVNPAVANPEVRLNVQVGTRVLDWEDNRKVSPAWKDVATKHAQILHAVAAAFARSDRAALETLLAPFHGPFDPKAWEEAIRRATPKSGSLTPKIAGG